MTSIRIFVATAGNEFMLDIARLLEDGFRSAGVDCQVEVDVVPSMTSGAVLQLVVAPHEFCTLFLVKKVDRARLGAALGQTFVLNVEQPGSAWFDTAWEYSRLARGVFDISREGVAEFRRRGIPALHAPLGYSPLMEAPAIPDHADRPVDVLFIGHSSARRQAFFARHADFFASRHCRIVLADVSRPRHADTPGYYAGANRLSLLASSKILVNIHSTDRPYFEAHRAILGISNRSLLVTETSRFTAPLVAGHHFVMDDLDELPAVMERLLADSTTLSGMARAGYDFVTREMTMGATCRSLLAATNDDAAQLHATTGVSENRDDRAAVLRRIADGRADRARGNMGWTASSNAAYERSGPPKLSTIVTLYNYGTFIEECLTSVVRSEDVAGGHELVVVDDASTDGSAERVERFMQQVDFPVHLIRKQLNTGLAETRNIGVRCARGQYVFILDADNWVYPSGPRVLAAALSTGQAVAAYGLLRRFDHETGESLGLLSTYEWNPRELVRNPYIDAMAMFDRQTILDVGGYATELIDHGWFGWEDYDLWLTLAQGGCSCLLVPRIVGAYREHRSSMLHRTNQTTDGIVRHFKRKFRPLMDRYPGLDRYFGYPASGTAEAPQVLATDESEIGELKATVRRLETQLTAMYASGSWRVTAPLRLALRLITRRP
jgi:GT2 family glycosyltransferase